MRRDYYAVLGITVAAEPREIRQAYRRLARQYSPDVNFWDRNARALFAEIEEAYRVLSDPSRRSMYDRFGILAVERLAADGRAGTPRRGDDVHAAVQLTFAEAVRGAMLMLEVPRMSPCRPCDASGLAVAPAHGAEPGRRRDDARDRAGDPSSARPEPNSGRSDAVEPHGNAPQRALLADTAARARRRGPARRDPGDSLVPQPCGHCRGRGVRRAADEVRVTIPAGVDSGTEVRVAEEGDAGPFGGPRGDLLVATRVTEHPFFSRQGDAVHCEVPVSVWEALLGARIRVPTPAGEAVLTLPPGLQDGRTVRLRGEGMPRLSGQGQGDLYVTLRIDLPSGVDARTHELLRELERLVPLAPRDALHRYGGGAQ